MLAEKRAAFCRTERVTSQHFATGNGDKERDNLRFPKTEKREQDAKDHDIDSQDVIVGAT
jgi:hypothetical protein